MPNPARTFLSSFIFLAFIFTTPLIPVARAQNYSFTINAIAGTNVLNDGGAATKSLLRRPEGVTIDAAGNLYVADFNDNRVRKITPSGIITTYAGDGISGYQGDGGPAVDASLSSPQSIAFDAAGNLYISDTGNLVIRRVTPAGVISTYAGSGLPGSSGDGGQALLASFEPTGIAVDSDGNLYIADAPNFRVRKVSTAGVITTIAGNGVDGFAGDAGPATNASLGYVLSLAIDPANNIFLADLTNFRIREINPAGIILTVAGNGFATTGGPIGPATATSIAPVALAAGATGQVYFSDVINQQIELLTTASGTIANVAGISELGFGSSNGGQIGSISAPLGLCVTSSGTIYIADTFSGYVRNPALGIVAGSGPLDGSTPLQAHLNHPTDVAVLATGSILVADGGNEQVLKFALPAGNTSSVGQFGLSGVGSPVALALDTNGNLYAATDDNIITQTDLLGNTNLIAGTFGQAGFGGDGGPATSALLNGPSSIAIDSSGNVFIADYGNSRIREVTPNGIINTIAGAGSIIPFGDGGPATSAGLDPYGIAVDTLGNLFVADAANGLVRLINPKGIISTIAGNRTVGFSGSGGPATMASLGTPVAVALDGKGGYYISDEGDSVIWRVTSSGTIAVIAGSGLYQPESGDGGPALKANMDPAGLAVDAAGNVYFADDFNDRVRILTPTVIGLGTFSITGGNNQTGSVGGSASQSLQVTVTGTDNMGYYGATVTFQVTSGSATLSSATAVTNASGVASVTVTFGSASGPVIITATVNGLAPVTFNLQSVNGPVISTGGIVGAGLSSPVVTALSPGGIFSIFGSGLAPAGTADTVGSADLVNGALPTNVAGTCVEVGGLRAPIFYISPIQINAQVPAATLGAQATVDVITACDTSSAVRSTVATSVLQAASPEFFYAGSNSDSTQTIVAVNTSTGLVTGGTTAAAHPGDVLELFATGLGTVNPAIAPGILATGAATVTGAVSVTIGGVALPASSILYAGVAPGFAGLYQINIIVPATESTGEQPVVISIGGVASPSSGVLNFAAAP